MSGDEENMKLMEAIEIREVQQKIALFGTLLQDLPLEHYLSTVDHASAIGPLLNPGTCDCEWMETTDQWKELATLLKDFRDAWKRMMAEKAEREAARGK